MARRKSKRKPSAWIGVMILIGAALVVWYGIARLGWRAQNFSSVSSSAGKSGPDVIEPANEGRKIRVSGNLSVPAAQRDPDLGVSADAIVLFRNVEMYQWQERCAGDDCHYDLAWSSMPVDSSKFRIAAGHENPRFPFSSARFASGPIKLGAFTVDPELVVAQVMPEKHAVRVTELPTNLAATFRESDGALVTGDDPTHPKAGALRVSYRVIAAGQVTVNGVQHGQTLSIN